MLLPPTQDANPPVPSAAPPSAAPVPCHRKSEGRGEILGNHGLRSCSPPVHSLSTLICLKCKSDPVTSCLKPLCRLPPALRRKCSPPARGAWPSRLSSLLLPHSPAPASPLHWVPATLNRLCFLTRALCPRTPGHSQPVSSNEAFLLRPPRHPLFVRVTCAQSPRAR